MSTKVIWIEEEPGYVRYEQLEAQARGWVITSVRTADEALEKVRTVEFDLVVLDLILPRDEYDDKRGLINTRAGVDFLRALRDPAEGSRTPPHVPVLVISCVVSPSARREVISHLSDDRFFLSKPVDQEAYRLILDEISDLLELPSN